MARIWRGEQRGCESIRSALNFPVKAMVLFDRRNEPGPPTSGHLEFKEFNGADVTVRGWPKLPNPTAQDNWIRDFSDHGLIYFEVQKV